MNLNNLIIACDSFIDIRISLENEGFHLPEVLLGHIEGLRKRPTDEQHYEKYLQELIKVIFGAGEKKTEKQISSLLSTIESSDYHSNYLNHLKNKFNSRELDTIVTNSRYAQFHLDPNFIIYLELKFIDDSKWIKYIEEYKRVQREDVERHIVEIEKLSYKPKKLTLARIQSLLEDILSKAGLIFDSEKSNKDKLIFRKQIKNDFVFYCEYFDHYYGMVKGKEWRLLVYVAPKGVEVTDDNHPNMTFNFPLTPGWEWYKRHDGQWELVVLGALFYGKYVQYLLSKLE